MRPVGPGGATPRIVQRALRLAGLLLCWLAATVAAHAAEAPHTVLRYGVLSNFSPFQVWPEGGRPGGADVEFAQEIARELGLTLQPVRYTDYTALEADLVAGRLQLASAMARTRERETRLLFTPAYTQVQLALVTRAERPSGALLPDLAGRSVAVVRGYASQEQVDRLFPLASRVVVGSLREGLEAVRSGRADTFLESAPVLLDLIERLKIPDLVVSRRVDAPSGRMHLAVPARESALALRLSDAIGRYRPERFDSLLQAWSVLGIDARPTQLLLDAADRSRLAAWAPPMVGLVGQEPPFAFRSAEGLPEGLSVDVLRAVLGRLGVTPSAWVFLNPADVPRALAEGRVDLVVGADEVADSTPLLRFVGPFIEYPTVLIGRPDSGAFDVGQLRGRRLALTPNSTARPWVDSRHPSVNVVDCAELDACLDLVLRGGAEATLTDVVTGGLALARQPRPELTLIGAEPQLRRYHSLAVAARHSEMVPLFKRSLDVVQETDLLALKVRWFSRPPQAEVLRAAVGRWLPWALMALLLLALLWMLHAQQLGNEVRRTRAAQLAAERASAANRRFTTFLAHEVRNSLHAVVAGAELAGDARRAGPEMNALLGESARSTLRLLNNLIDRERLDAGRLTLHPEPARLGALIDAVVHEMAPAAAVRGLGLVALPPQPDPLLLLDPLRLQQVLRNLVANAVKYSGAGRIEVHGEVQGDQVRVAVHDRGLGIAPDRLARIFEPFRGHADGGARAESSAGLGLPLCRDLARLMGGDVELQAREGGGTTALLRFPAAAAAAAQVAAPHALRVLVLEDSEVYGLLLVRAFEQQGHVATLAATVAQARLLLDNGRWDLVLSDLHLPDGTAHDLLAGLAGPAVPPVAVVMTADLDSLSPDQARLPGAAVLLEKTGDVRALVERALREHETARPGPAE